MSDEKCCCNCLHCARWPTSKGIECHCDLDDKYLGYLTVMNTDNDCCKWEKETKWELQEKHDKQIYNKAIDECIKVVGGNIKTIVGVVFDNSIPLNDRAYARSIKNDFIEELIEQLEQLKVGGKNG